ncbi:MAG TPA: hypothetical protein VFB03_02990 [Candidatus Saccharimonadales bacterium]|nr:hypothetical protein [Candidatus Saccharimonadales bacterium]
MDGSTIRITSDNARSIRVIDYRHKLRDNLADYLDIIQDLLTYAQEIPSGKQQEELLDTIDRMIDHYKELDESIEKVVGPDGLQ